jgi:hypothetical protein
MRMQMTREFFIPKGAIKVADKNSDAVVYVYERIGKPYAMGFLPKAQKPVFNHRYSTLKSREQRVRDFFEGVTAHKNLIAERRKARNAPHNVEVGAIFYTSWGYEQTNVDFYQVTRVISDRSVEVRKIGQNSTNTGSDTGYCVAVKDAFLEKEKPQRKQVAMFGGKPSLKIDDHHASLWDGKELRWSSYH